MTKKIVDFAKTKKAIFIKIDPDIIKTKFNYKNEEEKNPDLDEIFNTLKEV